jgi:putative endonuclease
MDQSDTLVILSLSKDCRRTTSSQWTRVKSYWVYMVLCRDGHFYVGVTNDVERRVAEHNLGTDSGCYTFRRRPVKLVHAALYFDIEEAIRWEKQLKGWSRAKKQALITEDWLEIRRLAHLHGGDSADDGASRLGRPSTGSG